MKSYNTYYGLVMVAFVLLAGPASAQMGKEGKGQSGMMGSGMMGSGMMGSGMMGSGMMGDGMMGDGMMGGGSGGAMGMGMMGQHGPGMEMGGMGEMMKMMRAMSALNLTPDQKKKLQLATIQHEKEAIPLLGQIRMAGVEIQELLLADPTNLDKVKSKVKEKYDAAAKLEMSHLALRQEVKKMLSPEQRQQMESMMEMGPMMGSMMGAPAGQAKEEPEPQATPNSPPGKESDSKDPHGH